MRRVLHIVTRPEDPLAQKIIQRQRQIRPAEGIEVVDLTTGQPEYRELLEKIFESDSVECW